MSPVLSICLTIHHTTRVIPWMFSKKKSMADPPWTSSRRSSPCAIVSIFPLYQIPPWHQISLARRSFRRQAHAWPRPRCQRFPGFHLAYIQVEDIGQEAHQPRVWMWWSQMVRLSQAPFSSLSSKLFSSGAYCYFPSEILTHPPTTPFPCTLIMLTPRSPQKDGMHAPNSR